MELNEYQKAAMETCLPESENFAYMMLNLVGEIGEFASKVAKSIRILWQLSGLCSANGWSLEEIARGNLEKLASRKERGVVDGSGDNR